MTSRQISAHWNTWNHVGGGRNRIAVNSMLLEWFRCASDARVFRDVQGTDSVDSCEASMQVMHNALKGSQWAPTFLWGFAVREALM